MHVQVYAALDFSSFAVGPAAPGSDRAGAARAGKSATLDTTYSNAASRERIARSYDEATFS